MLELLNRYAHRYVAIPVIVTCRKQGLFEQWERKSSVESLWKTLDTRLV